MNISSVSYTAIQRPDPAEFFKKADADGSGGINQQELATMLSNRPARAGASSESGEVEVDRIFSDADTDGDGQISAAENEAHLQKMEGNRPMRGSFEGSASSLDSLLQQLSSGENESATKDELITQLVARLKVNGSSASLFGADA